MTLAEKVYAASPAWAQDWLATLKGLEFEYRRVDRALAMATYHRLLESQYWSRDKITDHQDERLQDLLRSACAHVPHYRESVVRELVESGQVRSVEDLPELPVLTKQQLRGNEQRFVDSRVNPSRLRTGYTSGTTGTPLTSYYTRETFAWRWAFELRLRHWAGLPEVYYPRRAQFTGRLIVPNDRPDRFGRRNRAANALLMSVYHISRSNVPRYAEELRTFAPELVDGFPSALATLARLCQEEGIPLPSAVAVRTSSETLLPPDRQVIEEAFGCPVFDQYGLSETALFCSDNDRGEMLVHPEFGVLEIIDEDGNEVGIGEMGRVLATSFLNPVMPLIRYETGDLAVKGEGVTSEYGTGFPRIQEVVGRMDDMVETRERGFVGRLDAPLKGLRGVVEAQITKEAEEDFVVSVVATEQFDVQQREQLIAGLRNQLGSSVRVAIREVDSIPRGANGKAKLVVDKTRGAASTESRA